MTDGNKEPPKKTKKTPGPFIPHDEREDYNVPPLPRKPKKMSSDTGLNLTETVHMKAEELAIDPFEVLLMFAGGKWQELGYNRPEDISAGLRAKCASDACKYLYPQLRAVEVSGSGGGPVEMKMGLVDDLLKAMEANVRSKEQ